MGFYSPSQLIQDARRHGVTVLSIDVNHSDWDHPLLDARSAPQIAEEVLSDYRATGLTLRAHPLSLLRDRAPFNRCKRHTDLASIGHTRFVRIAGLVTCRQRPGTALWKPKITSPM